MPSSDPSDSPTHPPDSAPAQDPAEDRPLERTTSLNAPTSNHRPTSSRSDKDAILHPGTIRINVQGAFIVDEDSPVTSTTASPHLKPHRETDEDGVEYKHDTKDIRLPNQSGAVSHVAVDIGGSLAKLVYFSSEPTESGTSSSSSSLEQGGRLNFLKFETADRIDECIDLMHKLQQKHRKQLDGRHSQDLCVVATGGGAFKYYEEIRRRVGVEVLREDEMECLIIGLDFFIQEIPREVFTHNPQTPTTFLPPRTAIYPYLLVNIGSGVSMVKVTSPRTYTRVGGTSLGGGTLWGLLSLITGARSFDDMLSLAEEGDNTKVDMLVGDIYGEDTGYSKVGLRSSTIASSFGKVYKMKRMAEREAEDGGGLANGDSEHGEGEIEEVENAEGAGEGEAGAIAFRPEDVSRSLLYAVSYNIGQIAYLQSTIHSLPHIYFGGSFIRGHRQTMDTLSYAIQFWSKGEKQAYFLRHEGYLGAVGAFLKRQPRNWGRRNSFDGPAGKYKPSGGQEEVVDQSG